MPLPRFLIRLCPAATIVLCPGVVLSQDYPNKPLRIVTAQPGGGADFFARIIAQGLTARFGQQVIVDNRSGASGAIAIEMVAGAPRDGYTMLVYNNGLWTLPLLRKVAYHPVADFSPVAAVASMPNVLVVHPSLPVKTTAELIAWAKARPGQLSYASAGSGQTTHLAAELFKAMAGLDILHIPYKGSPSALNDLLGGRVQLMFPNAASVMPHVKSGRLRALAVTTAGPSRLFPDLPPVADSGLRGYQSVVTFGLFAPAKIPSAIINQLNQAVGRILDAPDVKERFFNVGAETVGGPPQQLGDTMKSEIARLGKVIKEAGIRED